jgi:hypothetical protein
MHNIPDKNARMKNPKQAKNAVMEITTALAVLRQGAITTIIRRLAAPKIESPTGPKYMQNLVIIGKYFSSMCHILYASDATFVKPAAAYPANGIRIIASPSKVKYVRHDDEGVIVWPLVITQ